MNHTKSHLMKIHSGLQEKLVCYQGEDHRAQNHAQKSFQQTLRPMLLTPVLDRNKDIIILNSV